MNLYAHVVPEVQESALRLLSQALAPKTELMRIEYERYDPDGKLIDSDIVEQELDLALMVTLSPKGWTIKARLIAQGGQSSSSRRISSHGTGGCAARTSHEPCTRSTISWSTV